jgi:4-aminobutyrate aminotransferase-like enzyme/GNAT superfamily N-acetyltransferase
MGGDLLAYEVECLTAVEQAIREGDVLSLIVEPYQCEGGDVSPTRRFFHGLRALTRAYGIPLIFDEVQSGFGLSGPVFWHERFQLADEQGNPEGPDFVTGAKRAQVGYVLSPYPDVDPGPAHAISARRGLAHLELITTRASHEALAREALAELAERWPQIVTRPRAFGDAFGFDLPTTEIAMHLIGQRFYQGYMVYIAGAKTLRYRLNRGFKPSEVHEVFHVINRSIEALVEQAGGVRDGGGEALIDRMSACKAPAWVNHDEPAEDYLPTLSELLSTPGEADLYLKRFGELSDEVRRGAEALLGLPAERAEGDARLLAQADANAFNAQAEAQGLGVSFNHVVADRLGVRVRRVNLAEFEAAKELVIGLEETCYEPARQDDFETLHAIASHPEGVVCFAEDAEGLVGMAFASPLEAWAHITGPHEDPNMGANNTLYSADITIDPRARGLGVGHRLRGATIKAAWSAKREDGSPRFHFVTGRNRVGEADVMWAVNQRWGAYLVKTYDNQYGEEGAQSRYYRVPLHRADRRARAEASTQEAQPQLWGVHNPTGAAHPLLTRARDLGVFDEGALTKLTVSNFITPQYARYAEALRLIKPRGTAHMYFTSCPDEMIDKSIRSLKHNRPEAQVVVSFEGARFGGNTAAGRSLGECDPHFGWPQLPHPSVDLKASLSALDALVADAGAEALIGVYVETIQPYTGCVLTDEAWSALCAWRDRTGVPLVLSEVNTGFGRSGRGFWWLDGAQGDADLVMWWAGGQVGHLFARPEVFVSTPLTFISTWDGEDLSGMRLLWQLYATQGGQPQEGLSAWLEQALGAHFNPSDMGGLGLFRSVRHAQHTLIWAGLKREGVQVQRLGDALIFAPPLTLGLEERARFEQALNTVMSELSS